MLVHLAIANFAIVDALELEFSDGMTVVTGETGAGKSIMLDALGLALGDRLESGVLGSDDRPGEITATFEVSGYPGVIAWLGERDLADNDSTTCILRRVITREGRSRGYINGHPSTVQDLRLLGDMLIDIHSQHEHQSLLKRDTQRRLLDEYGDLVASVGKVATQFDDWQNAKAELAALTSASDEQSARLQLLTYQAAELQQLDLAADEYHALEAELKLLASAQTRASQGNEALAVLTGSESTVVDQLGHVLAVLRDIAMRHTGDDSIKEILDLLTTSQIQLEEASKDLSHYVDKCEINPARQEEVEQRIGAIFEIARKHHRQPEELIDLQQEINDELQTLTDVDGRLETLESDVVELKEQYFKSARALHGKRLEAARHLNREVTARLTSLGMGSGNFEVTIDELDEDRATSHGVTEIEFQICTNPGQPLRPLNRVASGGELSRISLAIQFIVANTSRIPTLVFDEVDVGIGGGVAEVVGTLLRKLGAGGQILCVTHLPQVAAQGHQHLYVSKETSKKVTKSKKGSKGKKTETHIEQLDEVAKIAEIARMLGGVEITDQSMAHAKEMFETAQR